MEWETVYEQVVTCIFTLIKEWIVSMLWYMCGLKKFIHVYIIPCLTLIEIWCENIKTYLWVCEYLIKAKMAKYSFKVYFNNIPECHRPMWIYTMYAGMSTGKCNQI